MEILTIDQLKKTLAARSKKHITDPSRVASAVVVPLCYRDTGYSILLIKRTEKVKAHKGEISFPGGACEPGETAPEAAVRECFEEIGLAPEDLEILGELDDTRTLSTGYIVSPVVARAPCDYNLVLSPYEVDEVLEVPVSALLADGGHREKIETVDGEIVTVYTYHYKGWVIWGATARILRQLLEILTGTSVKH